MNMELYSMQHVCMCVYVYGLYMYVYDFVCTCVCMCVCKSVTSSSLIFIKKSLKFYPSNNLYGIVH